MKRKIENLFKSLKARGFKDNKHTVVKDEIKKFVNDNKHEDIHTFLKKEEPISKEDLILGMEIKYLDWLRGVW